MKKKKKMDEEGIFQNNNAEGLKPVKQQPER